MGTSRFYAPGDAVWVDLSGSHPTAPAAPQPGTVKGKHPNGAYRVVIHVAFADTEGWDITRLVPIGRLMPRDTTALE